MYGSAREGRVPLACVGMVCAATVGVGIWASASCWVRWVSAPVLSIPAKEIDVVPFGLTKSNAVIMSPITARR
ncbi:hypothetical protein D3C81_1351700 [compost metagenome]